MPMPPFQSTLPIREETRKTSLRQSKRRISIHSSHTGRDHSPWALPIRAKRFQSTLPIREETRDGCRLYRLAVQFQSTLPIREETTAARCNYYAAHDFNPLFPYGKRPYEAVLESISPPISIHSSHTGRDMDKALQASDELISIHSSHTGRDLSADAVSIGSGYNFNPLFPYGKRHAKNRKI